MKLLAIHSNKIFFKKNIEEDVPNFYEWLSEERGLKNQYSTFNYIYKIEDRKSVVILNEIFKLAAGGMDMDELRAYCDKYNEFYFDYSLQAKLKEIKKNITIAIFTSYPKQVYRHLEDNNLLEVYGTEGVLNEENKILRLREIKLENEKEIKKQMEKIGLEDEFSLWPNRYGLLELLIDKMIKENIKKDDIVVIGTSVASKIMAKVSSRQVENFEEL